MIMLAKVVSYGGNSVKIRIGKGECKNGQGEQYARWS